MHNDCDNGNDGNCDCDVDGKTVNDDGTELFRLFLLLSLLM